MPESNKQNWSNIFLSFVLLIIAIFVMAIVNKITTPQQEIKLTDNDEDGYYTIAIQDKFQDCNDNDF